MTATALAVTNAVANGVIAFPAGTPIDQANGMKISITTTGIPAAANLDRLVLLVVSTSTSDQVLTIAAGAAPVPAFEGAQGALAATIPAANGGGIVGPFDTAKFVQTDGSISLAFDAGSQGTITALLLPRTW